MCVGNIHSGTASNVRLVSISVFQLFGDSCLSLQPLSGGLQQPPRPQQDTVEPA
jgi:hypothetical protein